MKTNLREQLGTDVLLDQRLILRWSSPLTVNTATTLCWEDLICCNIEDDDVEAFFCHKIKKVIATFFSHNSDFSFSQLQV